MNGSVVGRNFRQRKKGKESWEKGPSNLQGQKWNNDSTVDMLFFVHYCINYIVRKSRISSEFFLSKSCAQLFKTGCLGE